MPVKDLDNASYSILKSAYGRDYKTPAEKKDHVHKQVIDIVKQTEIVVGISYPVIDLCVLVQNKYANVSGFLLQSIKDAGVRPETPFHNNDEAKYPVDMNNSFRYVEYNVIGGGMRLIYDATLDKLLLSAHYSDPAILAAHNEDSHEGLEFNDLMTGLRGTHKNLLCHSDGTYFQDEPTDWLKQVPKRDSMFREWLSHKNSGQATAVLKAYGLS